MLNRASPANESWHLESWIWALGCGRRCERAICPAGHDQPNPADRAWCRSRCIRRLPVVAVARSLAHTGAGGAAPGRALVEASLVSDPVQHEALLTLIHPVQHEPHSAAPPARLRSGVKGSHGGHGGSAAAPPTPPSQNRVSAIASPNPPAGNCVSSTRAALTQVRETATARARVLESRNRAP